MDNINDLIVKHVKDARVEKGFTQKDLADHLGRTAASISDLERGKVQVTASDLYKISEYLGKPIEYFFGENFGGEEIQNLVSILRSQSPEYRKANVEYIQKTVRLQTLGNEILNKPEEEITPEDMKEFMELLIDLTNKNKSASNQVEDVTKRLLTEIEFKGIDIRKYLSELQ
ncbi:MAG: helix-turn-helix transcriptional regulator [Chloroflexota bacterium]|nr:helix-turn-helix transcriptional regulator [Chloroflexota bacterium]